MDQTTAPRIDIDALRTQVLGCVRCPLSRGRTQVVWADGDLDSDVAFIGEAPGFHEDKQGRPFVGAAGQLLDKLMAEIGLDRTQCAIVNVLKCRPPGNRDPQPDEIESCKPYLDSQLAYMRPKVIVTLGNFATKFILESPIGITRARGQRYERRGAVVVPTFHPAAALRGGRFGGMSPIDAIRQDLAVVKGVLAEARAAEERAALSRQAEMAAAPSESRQLGLF
ncbi:MAG: uracil-DNA glycosylase [Actinomycetota bacterium]|nr:uracil-DNA glycosylase [Actinomycetota bacterium]